MTEDKTTEQNEEQDAGVKLPVAGDLLVSSSPHLHDGQSVTRIMITVIVCLLPACLAGVYFFGINAIRVILLCSVFCVLAEMLWCKLAGTPQTWKDGTAILTGILLALNLNAGIPWWVCLVGAFLAIWLGKKFFGGLGHNPFNPALVARVGLLIGFPKLMTTWVLPMTKNRFEQLDAATGATPLGVLQTHAEAAKDGMPDSVSKLAELVTPEAYWDYFIGNVGGCIGETSVLALLVGGIALICLKLIRWQVPVAYIGTVAIFTGIIHLISPGTTPGSVFHVLTGGLLIGAFFMATDMVTSPMTGKGAFIFGMGCGIVTCVIRIWCNYPEGVSFSILFMNAWVPFIDRYTGKKPFGYRPPEPEGEAA